MAKKILKKAAFGREVTKSDSGQYKTIDTNKGTRVRRTVKGVIKGAPTVAEANANRADAIKNPSIDVKNQAKRVANMAAQSLDPKYGTTIFKNSYDSFIKNNAVDKSNVKKYGDFKKGGTAKTTTKKKK
jgi:hypothetical protein